MTSKNYVKGIITIHTTSDINSPHIDYDDIKNLNIHEVENYGATGTVQLVNNYPVQTKNLLSNYCDLWSDHVARKLDRAMFLRIYHDSRTTANAIGVYLITQINASDGLITLTFCDSVQYLRSVGADYVMNHYRAGSQGWHDLDTKWENNEARLYHASGAELHGGSHHDIIMGKMVRKTYNASDETREAGSSKNIKSISVSQEVVCGRTIHKLHKITFKELWGYHTGSSQKTKNARFYCTTSSGGHTINFKFDFDGNKRDVIFDFKDNPLVVDKERLYFTLTFYVEGDGDKFLFFNTQKNVPECEVDTIITGGSSVYYREEAMRCDIICSYDTDNVVGTNTNDYFKVDTLDGEAPTQESIEIINHPGRSRGFYIDPSARISSGDVFVRIIAAQGFSCENFTGRTLNLFRCNGDLVHNYLLALADMPNGDRQYAFASSPTDWNHINTGLRYKKTDQTAVYFYYAYFGAIEGGTPMMSFNPSITMRNHPRMSVVKGTDKNNRPIMVAVLDPKVSMGSSTPTVNGSITTPIEGALTTYSDIITNRSDEWQGEIKVSGIHLDYLNGGSVSGIPISITDHRYGFADYKAKVKEITWDFANQTTTIVVNNYSEMYSNAILDTSKMAYSAGDLSAEGSNVDMFTRQFVNLDMTSMTSSGDTARMKIHPIQGVEAIITDATTIDMPELNIRVVNGYFPPGVGTTTQEYAVWDVQVGDRTHEIPTARRPDKYSNQSLIVNVIYRLS